MNRVQAAEQFRKALQFFARTLDDEEAMEVACVYPTWAEEITVNMSDVYAYGTNEVGDPQLYRCLIAHKTQADWTPDISPSLWKAIGVGGDGIPVWSQPVGSADAYKKGDKVHYPDADSPVYESLIDGNIWSPDAYPAGWRAV